jgi:hypothetical protein
MPTPLLSRSVLRFEIVPLSELSCRVLDPVLGVFTGVFAYYLYETNPRTAFPPGEKLPDLLRWKWSKWRQERDQKLRAAEVVQWKEITAEKAE